MGGDELQAVVPVVESVNMPSDRAMRDCVVEKIVYFKKRRRGAAPAARSAAGQMRVGQDMGNRTFENPVWVLASEHFCRQVASAWEAVAFLRQWSGRRAGLHSHTIAICTYALAGSVCSESARQAFIEFAEREQILVEKMSGDLLNSAIRGPSLAVH